MQATVGAANPANRTDSFSTDFSSRAQSFAGQAEEEGGTMLRGSISNKLDLKIDIPVDKKADHNPGFKTPPKGGEMMAAGAANTTL